MTASTTDRPATSTTSKLRYLSDLCQELPQTGRLAFISHLKQAIHDGTIEGAPLDDTFTLHYTAKGEHGPEQRQKDQRDFALANTPTFERWLTDQLNPKRTTHYGTRAQLEGGQLNLSELAARYRKSKTKPKARR